jgi:Yip1-like protein
VEAHTPAAVAQRFWWARAVLVLVQPVAVFEELRDDSDDAADARQEPALAIVILAGIAGVLSTSFAGTLVDRPEYGTLDIVLWAFVGGALEGVALYFLLGLVVYVGGAAAQSTWTFRHARHTLAYSVAPLAASLPIWAIALTADRGAAFDVVRALVVCWCAALLVIGVKTLHAWTWQRTLAGTALPLLVPLLILLRAQGLL